MTSAIERLRALLAERGVEYEGGERSLRWRDRYGIMMQAFPLANGELGMEVWSCTPEQAVEATLGRGYEPPLAAHWDGDTLTLTIPRDPSCIRVQRSAEQPCKVYADESKVIAATLGRGTCRMVLAELRGPAYTDTYECSECGEEVMVGTVMGESEPPKWCPNCGRRVVTNG